MKRLLMFLGILYPLMCSGEWWITTVDSHSLGGSSIAIDSLGIPHIAYTKYVGGGKWFFNYTSWNPIDSNWTLEFTHDSSYYPKLKLDSKGLPHIVSDQFWYIWKDTNDVWNKENVRHEIGSGWYSHRYSLALDTNDYPHILGVYRSMDWHPPDSFHIFLLHWYKDNEGWHAEIVDTVSNYTYDISITIDNENVIHIAYSHLAHYPSHPHPYLCYAKKIDGIWHEEPVTSRGGGGNSIALDTAGLPCIVFWSNELKFARKDNGEWKVEVADTTYNIVDPVLGIDKDNYPRIAYLCIEDDDTTRLGNLKYAWFDGDLWNTTIVERGIFGAWKQSKDKIFSTFIDMEIDKYGNSHICYDNQGRLLEKELERYAVGHGFMGIEERQETRNKRQETRLTISPNPFLSVASIKYSVVRENPVSLRVYDMMGRLVEETNVEIEDCKIGEKLRAGIYFVKVKGYKTTKIIKMGGVR